MTAQQRVTWKQLGAGSLVEMPVGPGLYALGQIVVPGIEFYLCGFLPLERKPISARASTKGYIPAICALMNDAPLYHGKWRIVGSAPIATDIPMPLFKVGHGGKGRVVVTDIDDKIIRDASKEDQEMLPYKTNFGANNVADTLRQLHDGNSPDPAMADMLVSQIRALRERETAR